MTAAVVSPRPRAAARAIVTGASMLLIMIWTSLAVAQLSGGIGADVAGERRTPAAWLALGAVPSALTSGSLAVWRTAPASAPALTAAERDTVLAYAGGLLESDRLVQVRPGVYAKRSNVEGVATHDRTLYYDIYPDQSFGPLRAGRWQASEVVELARVANGRVLIIIYVHAPDR